MPDVQPETKEEKAVEQLAEKLDIELPKTKLPGPAKVIGLLLVLGGVSVAGSFVTDTILGREAFSFGVLRLLVGLTLAVIGYGLIRRRLLALLAFIAVSLVGAYFNPVSLLLTVPITVYLIAVRHFLRPGILGRWFPSLRHEHPMA